MIRCAQACVTEVTPLFRAFDQQPACKGTCSLVVAVTLSRSWVRIPMRANFMLGKKGHLLFTLVGMDEPTCGGRALV